MFFSHDKPWSIGNVIYYLFYLHNFRADFRVKV